MSLKIRKASPEDSRALAEIHTESWKVAYKDIVPNSFLDNMNVEKREKRFYNSILQGLGLNIIVFKNDKLARFMCLGKCRDQNFKI